MTVGIYIRVSTEEQAKEGYSISAQREKLKAFCIAQGWDDFKFYVEEGLSGKNTKRPKLNELMKHIEQGSINTLLVYRLDRLTRSVMDLHKLLAFMEKHNCTFKSATEVYDTSTAMGRMFITIVASIAQWESENLGERVKMGQIEKARQGEWAAAAPFGFKKVDSRLVQDPDNVEILRDMIDKIESGYSFRMLANHMNATSLKPPRGYQWHVASLLAILSNPALYGAMRWRDEVIEGTHEGVMDRKQFERLQQLISSRQNLKKRNVKSIFIFQMKLTCPECGNHLTSERSVYYRKKDKKQIENNAYRCQVCALKRNNPPFRVPEKHVITAMEEYFKGFVLKNNEKTSLPDQSENKIEKLEREIHAVENQRTKYQKAWAMDLMTDEEFTKLMAETKNVLDKLKVQHSSQIVDKPYLVDKETLIKVGAMFNDNWTELNNNEKREFVERFIQAIHIRRHGKSRGKGFRDYVFEITDIKFR